MKRILAVLVLMVAAQVTKAQDFKKVQTNIIIGQYDAAKSEYEKVVAKKPSAATTAEGYFWKSKIYSGLNKDAAKNPDAFGQLKAALIEYIKLDKANNYAIAKENGQDPFFDVYTKSFKDGVDAFNSKQWKEAATQFESAVEFSDIIFSNGWSSSKQKFDTTSLVYAGYSNQNANNTEKTLAIYKRMADAKITSPDYIDIYRYILVKLSDNKDKVGFDNYLQMAIAGYPNDNWNDYAIDYIEKNFSMQEKVALYEQKMAAGALKEADYQMFGDMFMTAKSDDPNQATYIAKAASAYTKAFEMNPKNFAAAFNIGIASYNQFVALDEKVSDNIRALQQLNSNKPAAPKDPKKKMAFDAAFKAQQDSIKKLNTALEPQIREKVDASIIWITKAFEVLKDKPKLDKAEKNVAGKSVDFLATLYAYKRDKSRGKDQKASDEFDVKFNSYDKLHEKYNN
jgi:hypothetical protein